MSSPTFVLPPVVVMGVSGSGKSTIGAALAAAVGVQFIDGDDLHPSANKAKMGSGIPLTDADRQPWLAAVGDALASQPTHGPVVACSALKVAYRDTLRSFAPDAVFLHLAAGSELIRARMVHRANHFMPAALLDSQLDTLEPLGVGERGEVLDTSAGVDEIVNAAVAYLRASV